ncbi:hypothetical protein HMPREF0379_1472 [[Eubacterium] yurii subsp. margaretiae ATCC 43715]|nr:hypothetical protein HMPREF0379_1472 [[Eubacterium] yurii subsp. margaretiae ATCC 43715]
MKKLLKLSMILMVLSILTISSNAITKLNPKATLILPEEAFKSDIAVYNKYIFYTIPIDTSMDSKFKTYSKSVFSNQVAKQINKVDGVDRRSSVFKILGDQKLYSVAHYGDNILGGTHINQLNKDKSVNMSYSGNASFEIDAFKNKLSFIHDPYFFYQGRSGYWYCKFFNDIDKCYYNLPGDIVKMGPLFSAIRKDYTYVVNYQYDTNNGGSSIEGDYPNVIEAPGIISINNSNNQKKMLIPDAQNMVMGSDCIYYYKKTKGKNLYSIYSYSLKNKSTKLICADANLYYSDVNNRSDHLLFPVKNNIFYMGGKNSSRLYTVSNKKSKPVLSGMKRIMSNGNVVVALIQRNYDSQVKIFNDKGVEIANLTVPNNDSDMFIYKNELIMWSKRDKKVRYYNIPVK